MKRVIVTALGVAFLTSIMPLMALASQRHASRSGVRITMLKVSRPHEITEKKPLIYLYLRIHGLKWTATKKHPLPRGKGFVQIYLDKIPGDAYKKVDFKGRFAAAKPSPLGGSRYELVIGPTAAWFKLHKGHHELKIGLARNNYVMYPVKAVGFALNVK